jgi:putative tricarboxylic transport membrane protein
MRIAEMVMAIALALLAFGIMWKSGERPDWMGEARFSNIGFGNDGSPQGGFWPFWVSAITFVCAIWVFVNGLLRRSPQSQSDEPYLDGHGIEVLLKVAIPVFLLVLLTGFISMYAAMMLFLFYYTFFLGRHGLLMSLSLALVLPAWMYLFFDITMTRPLPKGSLWVDDTIYAPLGSWFRQADSSVTGLFFLVGGVLLAGASWISARNRRQA